MIPIKKQLSKAFLEKIIKKYKKTKQKRPIYVIQEHKATRLHWDLRLEFNNTLKSWALPKKPSRGKRLAIQVENHPLEYACFKGTIPKGSYGAGTVKIWDKGTFELIKKSRKGLVLKIKGRKLKGTYVLFKFREPRDWLFFKKKD